MRKFFHVVFAMLCLFLIAGCGVNGEPDADPASAELFEKDIERNDLAIEYTVYDITYVSVTVKPLVDVENLIIDLKLFSSEYNHEKTIKWMVGDLKDANGPRQATKSIAIPSGATYDRIAIEKLSGKKANRCASLSDQKIHGIIKPPRYTLDPSLFSVRIGTTADHDGYAVYIKSSADLYDVSLAIVVDRVDAPAFGYLPDSRDFIANQENEYIMTNAANDGITLRGASVAMMWGRLYQYQEVFY